MARRELADVLDELEIMHMAFDEYMTMLSCLQDRTDFDKGFILMILLKEHGELLKEVRKANNLTASV